MIHGIQWHIFILTYLLTMPLFGSDIGKAKDEKEYEKMVKYVESHRVKEKDIARVIEKNGEMIDCVYIDKQPGMQREDMEGHIISKQPSFNIPAFDASVLAQKSIDISGSAFRVDCPTDTVPIKRLDIKNVKKYKTLKHFFSKYNTNKEEIAPQVYGSQGHEYAVVQRSIFNHGAGSYLNLWKPHVDTTPTGSPEMTLSQIWVTGGSSYTQPNTLETVEAGWQVYPDKYGDSHAHFFIYFTNMGYDDTDVDFGRCYNLDCRGFIQTNNNLAIGIGFPFSESSYSQTNGQQMGFIIRWQRDQSTGHWWLIYGTTPIGYYPNSLFESSGLKDHADYVGFGGEVMNQNINGHHTGTDMGSGAFAAQGYGAAAYQTGAQYISVSFPSSWTQFTITGDENKVVSYSSCYSLGYTELPNNLWGTYFYFGGPGYSANCP